LKKNVIRIIAAIITIVVGYKLVEELRKQAPAALEAWHQAHVNWPLLVLSVVAAVVGQLVFVVGWKRFLADCGVNAGMLPLTRFFLVSQLGRYLPGAKAWQMGIIGAMAAENNLPAALLAATSLIQGTVGVVVGAMLLFATGSEALGIPRYLLVLPIAGLIGLILLPQLLRLVPKIRDMLVKRLPSLETITAGTMWTLVWSTTASWISWGVALYVLAWSLLGDPGASIVAYTAAWIGPFLAGIIAIIVPAGLGVRDSVMQQMLNHAGVAAANVAILVVIVRIWVTFLDVVPALVVLGLRKRRAAVTVTPPESR
jgi:glycosyltransferase 2 family protein